MNFQILVPFFLVFLISNVSTINGCHDYERSALLSFKSQLTDPSNRLSSWTGQNCCNWTGIHCSDLLHVTSVDLRNPNPESFTINTNSELISDSTFKSTALIGNISSSLFSLTHITFLDLSFNNFTYSKIPPGIANLTSLTYLNLSNARFKDSITVQFSNLTALEHLDLSCTSVVVDLSSISYNLSSNLIMQGGPEYAYLDTSYLSSKNLNWLQGLRKVKSLKLSGVDLSQASKFSDWANPIGSLSNLKLLRLSSCKISGEVPNHFLNLTQLSVLIMDFNPITSRILVQLANLTNLYVLHFTSTKLFGPIPYLPQLRELRVGNSDLTIDLKSMFALPWPQLQILDIRLTQVSSSIPSSFTNTTSLTSFVAFSCLIEGDLPPSIANLSNMEVLNLNYNKLRAHLVPSISNMRNLQVLTLSQNYVQGNLPDSICNITSLWYLSLGGNKFSGELPDCIHNLPNLDVFFVSHNSFSGTIQSLTSLLKGPSPYMIGLSSNNLTLVLDEEPPFPFQFQPEILDLSNCNIKGKIPNFLSTLTQLKYLTLSYNYLSGEIPSWLFNLPQLGYLDLSFNNLQGTIPSSIRFKSFFGPTTLKLAGNYLQGLLPSKFDNIDAINLSGNNFTGSIPEQVGLRNVRYLSLSYNKLVGRIPYSFCQQNSSLVLLDLSNNSLSGTLAISLGHCTSLSFLNVARNNLSGSIPEELQNARNIAYLDLTSNHFEGPFPSFIVKMKNLMVLEMGYNKFVGKISPLIGELGDLRILVMKSNFFNETIPREINKLQSLQILDLSNNNFSGTIPEKLDGLKTLITRPTDGNPLGYVVSFMYGGVELAMAYKGLVYQFEVVRTYHSGIDLSLNSLTGSIPKELTLLKGLAMLNLSHNSVSGDIPSNIGDMIGLQSLDLSFNKLTGKIPNSINLLDALGYMNLSHNNLSGKIPEGTRFDTLFGDGSLYIGNELLCGSGNLIKCDENTSSTEESDSDEDRRQKILFIGVVALGYGVGFWVYFGILYLLKEHQRESYWKFFENIAFKICIQRKDTL